MKKNKGMMMPAVTLNLMVRLICSRIESDINYQPDITDTKLLNMVQDKPEIKGKSVLAILPYRYKKPLPPEIARLYQIKIVREVSNQFGVKYWTIKNKLIIVIHESSDVFIQQKEEIKKGNFSTSKTDYILNNFLDKKCYHEQDLGPSVISSGPTFR